ncbi:carboxylating nicotinate-nucleotide diphosphorylase [Sulfurisphaera ohwakuensis]|uniref:Nicotinate-nucleotide pyrophosphorylase [carboxylating] n=1 Tax=Sulfurisphaera ohwakuensis TaxID=69656 RepID=A0A650CGX9_SULOH|nr:carboxylating nicotinate-nucleotide diphosphorylase [Sulfurisphaera ohwakuensis]MBB5252614.1 nicotinate-nucleotide pyrophosphorylase (carboxylating) [Sulfurisphaera ohwakuensis]QGR16945.1 carboxylating nicotinate-nucleotide diphosphorylase [Sulfurisphaera ohwakuensis]
MIKQIMINKLLSLLEEDTYPEDVTSKIVSGIKCKAIIISKDEGILAGQKFIIPFLEYLGIKIENYMKDGTQIKKKDIVLEIEGDAETILGVERLVLNLLGKLSGISTVTHLMTRLAKSVNPNVRIAGTRKTTPGLRVFEKYAIEVGGGDPHRFNLSDAVLIKDNHIALIGSVKEAIRRAKEITSFTKKIEVEVSSLKDALEAYQAGADAILLDNMKPEEIIPVVNELKGKVIVEASGGINPDNVIEYAKTGVDIISSGYITHSSRSLDFSLDVYKS